MSISNTGIFLASTHFNENLRRDKKVSKTGEQYYKVVWCKYKDGEVVVKERSIPPAYGNCLSNWK